MMVITTMMLMIMAKMLVAMTMMIVIMEGIDNFTHRKRVEKR
jgi:hypothetical protein